MVTRASSEKPRKFRDCVWQVAATVDFSKRISYLREDRILSQAGIINCHFSPRILRILFAEARRIRDKAACDREGRHYRALGAIRQSCRNMVLRRSVLQTLQDEVETKVQHRNSAPPILLNDDPVAFQDDENDMLSQDEAEPTEHHEKPEPTKQQSCPKFRSRGNTLEAKALIALLNRSESNRPNRHLATFGRSLMNVKELDLENLKEDNLTPSTACPSASQSPVSITPSPIANLDPDSIASTQQANPDLDMTACGEKLTNCTLVPNTSASTTDMPPKIPDLDMSTCSMLSTTCHEMPLEISDLDMSSCATPSTSCPSVSHTPTSIAPVQVATQDLDEPTLTNWDAVGHSRSAANDLTHHQLRPEDVKDNHELAATTEANMNIDMSQGQTRSTSRESMKPTIALHIAQEVNLGEIEQEVTTSPLVKSGIEDDAASHIEDVTPISKEAHDSIACSPSGNSGKVVEHAAEMSPDELNTQASASKHQEVSSSYKERFWHGRGQPKRPAIGTELHAEQDHDSPQSTRQKSLLPPLISKRRPPAGWTDLKLRPDSPMSPGGWTHRLPPFDPQPKRRARSLLEVIHNDEMCREEGSPLRQRAKVERPILDPFVPAKPPGAPSRLSARRRVYQETLSTPRRGSA